MPALWDPVNGRVLRFGGGGQAQYAPLFQFTIADGWSQVTPSNLGPFNGRIGSGFVYDSQRNRMLVIGGGDWKGSTQSEVWALSLDPVPAWTQISFAGTMPIRKDFTTIYDPIQDRVLLYAGTTSGGTATSDVWQLTLSGTPTWSQITPSGSPPPARYTHVAIFDPVRDRMIIDGGINSGGLRNDAWALSLSGTPTWSQIAAPNGPAVFYSAAVYDPVRDRMAVITGVNAGNPDSTWFLSLKRTPFWTALPAGPVSVGPRYQHAAVYEPDLDLILAIGGTSGTGFVTDTRRLDCAGGFWLEAGASNGSVQVVPTKACYATDEHVTLVASPSGGAMFNQWLGDASGNANPLDVTMDASKTIFAEIVPRMTGVEDEPVAFAMSVHPNPSTGPIDIEYALPRAASVRLMVYDVAGREVARLVDGSAPAGRHVARWSALTGSARAHSGIYLARYETPAGSWTRRIVVLK